MYYREYSPELAQTQFESLNKTLKLARDDFGHGLKFLRLAELSTSRKDYLAKIERGEIEKREDWQLGIKLDHMYTNGQ